MKPVLSLRNLSKRFPTHHAVKEMSLEIQHGEFFALLGPSGCGKTTTLRMVAGFESPTSGEIHLNGSRIDHLPPYRRNVNTVFQSYALFPHLTVRGNIEFGLRRKGVEPLADRVAKVLEQVRLEGKESRMPSELSGGERQRVALARSLVLAPDVLLLDEPLSALDPQLRKQVRAELKDLQRRSGVAFLFVTHDQDEALSMSDRMAVMNAGEVEQIGSPQELYQRPRTRFVASFLGAMNWIGDIGVRPECTRISRTPSPPDGGFQSARSCSAASAVDRRSHESSSVHANESLLANESLRADESMLASEPIDARQHGFMSSQLSEARQGARSARVTRCVFLGSSRHVESRCENGDTLVAQIAPSEIFNEGDSVYISWNPEDEIHFD